ncbi:MAG TPA: MaoC/PaaZ C-terminal domain-containing protein [Solirubrobacterales bacterium]|nr:MaoC/PaaZ C-terminal domain-containing protein [Solirubrobacterales bacterium]
MAVRKLESPPSSLELYARAGLGAIPGTGRLPFLPGGGGDVPDIELQLDDVAVDADRLAAYCKVCGFTMRDTLPPTYPHILAFPLHMALLTDSSFPFPAIGMVHISNRIRQVRPIGVDERLSLSVSASRLRPHPKGKTFSLITEARAGAETVWTAESVNLRRGGSGGDDEGGRRADTGPTIDLDALDVEAQWSLPGDLGRRYADVSGDRNPIHLYGLTAKAFGFPRQIAHGMWSKARALAQLEPRLPATFETEVAFKKPILLPAKVEFASSEAAGRVDFGIRDAHKATTHLVGTATPST